jgi:heterodisulfide reductase subunit C
MLETRLNFKLLEVCADCGACYNVCPSSLHIEGYDPRAVIRDILAGTYERWLTSKHIWQCLECHHCLEICFQHYGFENAMTALRTLAVKKGITPTQVKKGWEMFAKSGRLGEPFPMRKRFGLPEPKQSAKEEFLKLHSLYRESRLPRKGKV